MCSTKGVGHDTAQCYWHGAKHEFRYYRFFQLVDIPGLNQYSPGGVTYIYPVVIISLGCYQCVNGGYGGLSAVFFVIWQRMRRHPHDDPDLIVEA